TDDCLVGIANSGDNAVEVPDLLATEAIHMIAAPAVDADTGDADLVIDVALLGGNCLRSRQSDCSTNCGGQPGRVLQELPAREWEHERNPFVLVGKNRASRCPMS